MSHCIHIPSYLSRIGCAATPELSLDFLRALVRAHTQNIPFENLTPLSGQPVLLDLAALECKIVANGRGGYCFEQNLLLQDVLQQLGFGVTGLAARVLWNAPPETVLPRTHMVLLVEIEAQRYLVDVGFGGLTLTGVLHFQTRVDQPTPHESFRLDADENEYIVRAHVRGEWRPLYRFDLQPQMPIDYEPVNWYLSTHAESRFVKNLIAARVLPDRRYALFNTELAIHILNGETQRRTISNVSELRDVLIQEFLIRVPEGVETTLTKVIGDPASRERASR